jgi:CRISPR/Cas system-associated endonuclease/helicase Cas3
MKSIAKIIELSKWFHRKSQHYIMGNWAEYEKKDYWWNTVNNPQKARNYKYYKKYYLQSYIRFMWLCRHEIMNA